MATDEDYQTVNVFSHIPNLQSWEIARPIRGERKQELEPIPMMRPSMLRKRENRQKRRERNRGKK